MNWNLPGAERDSRAAEKLPSRMPKKIRELIDDLRGAGFQEIPGGGKGSHWKFAHPRFSGVVTISGQAGDDAKPYQEKQVKQAIEQVTR